MAPILICHLVRNSSLFSEALAVTGTDSGAVAIVTVAIHHDPTGAAADVERGHDRHCARTLIQPKPQLRAKVIFLTHDQGGFSSGPKRSGIRPLMKIGDVFTSCSVWAVSEGQLFEPGVEYEVGLELLGWKEYRHEIYTGMPLQLNQGSTQVVGRGIISSIIGET